MGTSGPVVAVLSTSFSGKGYFADLLAGVASELGAVDGRLIAVQTCPAGASALDLHEPPDFRLPIAWDHVAGVAAILNGVSGHYLASVQALGKPVVTIGDELPGVSCPVVLPDNRAGIRAAVEHLLGHGHRAIAFAGFPVSRDIKERYQAYQECLRDHGIEPDPALFFPTGDNQVDGGERAARAMIAAGLPSTAVITGNDYNARGLIRALAAGGCNLPDDQAVVGFDDMDGAVHITPSLATVRQETSRVGATAARIVLAGWRGETVPDGPHYVPTVLVPRQSCGCPTTLSLRTASRATGSAAASPAGASLATASQPSAPDTREHLRAAVHRALAGPSAPSAPPIPPASSSPSPVDAALDVVEEALLGALRGDLPEAQRVCDRLGAVQRLCPGPEAMVEVARAVRDHGRHLAAALLPDEDSAGRRLMDDAIAEIHLALALTRSVAAEAILSECETNFAVQHAVGMKLLRSGTVGDPRRLEWLSDTPAIAAVLASVVPGRTAGDGPALLNLDGTYRAADPRWRPADGTMTVPSFPPPELIRLADPALGQLVFVATLALQDHHQDLFAVVGQIDERLYFGREVMNQWAALLATAIDRRTLLESLKTQEEMLRHAALYDALTGLPNRSMLSDRLHRAMEHKRRRRDHRFGLCLLDLDDFKLVNDSLGHLAGDELLIQVSSRIRKCLRTSDFAARLGGDEFALILDDVADEQDVDRVLARVRRALAEPFLLSGQRIAVTASMGVALAARASTDPDELIRDADVAMYAAKSHQKGTHAVFDVAMHTGAVERLRTEGELRRALAHGELELHYQPIVALGSGRTVALEALIRWRHPEKGILPPAHFLPVAEERGLMLPIGQWVVAEGCRQLGAWERELGDREQGRGLGVGLNLNIDNRQFWHGQLLDEIDEALRRADLAPDRIRVEITEGVIMHDVQKARHILDGLRARGVDVHIDDFGTGRSSLEALNHLKIDALKIDKSFVQPLPDDQRSLELVRAIVAMGHSLGLKLIAEGIETADQHHLLRALGCEFGQGYLFSRPLTAAAARDHLAAALASDPKAPAPVPAARSRRRNHAARRS